MKKYILALCCALTLSVGSNYSTAQSLSEGNVHLDIYTAHPNLLNNIFRVNDYALDVNNQVEVNTIPTLGLKFGYMLADNVSLGIDFNYSSILLNYTDLNTNFDYSLGFTRMRAMARFEVHFDQSNDDIDIYLPIAAGFHKLTPKVSTTDPGEQDLANEVENILGIFDFPFAFRLGFGGRYYFTDNIGLNLEIGIGGGPPVSGGLSLKF